MRWPRKVSNILQTSVKFSKNPSGKTLQNCFEHRSFIGSGKRNEQKSYYSPPLVGKSHEEDTITTHFDWKKQNPILLVARWEDQTATEDTTATLHLRTTTKFTTTASVDWERTGTRTSVSAGKRKLKMQAIGRSTTTTTLNVNKHVDCDVRLQQSFFAKASFKTMQDLIL